MTIASSLLTNTPAPDPNGPVFLYSPPWFVFFQIAVPILAAISSVTAVVFMIRRHMFKNVWHKLVFFNRLAACSYDLSRLGMLVFVQMVRNDVIDTAKTVNYGIVHSACTVFKSIEIVGLNLSFGSCCSLFYCLYVLQSTYQKFLLGGNTRGTKGKVYLLLAWICFVEVIFAIITMFMGDEFVISDSYCLMVSKTESHLNVFRISGPFGFIFPYVLGWLWAIRLFCGRQFNSIHAAFWPIRRMLFWLGLVFFITNGWLVVNFVVRSCYYEPDYQKEKYIASILVSSLQNVFDAVIIIYLVLEDIKLRRSFGTEFTEAFQTPCLINERLVIGPTSWVICLKGSHSTKDRNGCNRSSPVITLHGSAHNSVSSMTISDLP